MKIIVSGIDESIYYSRPLDVEREFIEKPRPDSSRLPTFAVPFSLDPLHLRYKEPSAA
jgi:hypothetical protein